MTQAPVSSGLKPHRGPMILVFGILGFVCCFLFGVTAWIMGGRDLQEMDSGIMDPEGRGLTKAGKICGMISAILGGIWFVVWIILMITGGLAGVLGSR